MDEVEQKIIITKNGQQIPVQARDGAVVSIYLPDDEVDREVQLDVSAEAFIELQEQAVTNDIPADILSSKKAD